MIDKEVQEVQKPSRIYSLINLPTCVGVWQVWIVGHLPTTFISDQSGRDFHCFIKLIVTLQKEIENEFMLDFYVTSSTSIEDYTSHQTDKSLSVINWGIFRLYANAEVVWRWSQIDTLTSVKRKGWWFDHTDEMKYNFGITKLKSSYCGDKQKWKIIGYKLRLILIEIISFTCLLRNVYYFLTLKPSYSWISKIIFFGIYP